MEESGRMVRQGLMTRASSAGRSRLSRSWTFFQSSFARGPFFRCSLSCKAQAKLLKVPSLCASIQEKIARGLYIWMTDKLLPISRGTSCEWNLRARKVRMVLLSILAHIKGDTFHGGRISRWRFMGGLDLSGELLWWVALKRCSHPPILFVT